MKSPYSPHDSQTPSRPVATHRYSGGIDAGVCVFGDGASLLTVTSRDRSVKISAQLSAADLKGLSDMFAIAAKTP